MRGARQPSLLLCNVHSMVLTHFWDNLFQINKLQAELVLLQKAGLLFMDRASSLPARQSLWEMNFTPSSPENCSQSYSHGTIIWGYMMVLTIQIFHYLFIFPKSFFFLHRSLLSQGPWYVPLISDGVAIRNKKKIFLAQLPVYFSFPLS